MPQLLQKSEALGKRSTLGIVLFMRSPGGHGKVDGSSGEHAEGVGQSLTSGNGKLVGKRGNLGSPLTMTNLTKGRSHGKGTFVVESGTELLAVEGVGAMIDMMVGVAGQTNQGLLIRSQGGDEEGSSPDLLEDPQPARADRHPRGSSILHIHLMNQCRRSQSP